MRKFLAFVAFLVAGAVLFALVLSFVGWPQVWEAIAVFWGAKGAVLVLVTLLMLVLGAFRWKEILRHQGFSVPLSSILYQYFGGFAVSFFFPMAFFGSEAFRSWALKELHQVPLARGAVSVTAERFLELIAYLLYFGAGLGFLLVSHALVSSALFWGVLLIAGLLVFFLAFFFVKSHRKESILAMIFPRLNGGNGFLEMEQELLRFFSWKNRAFWEGMALSLAKASLALLRTVVLAAFLGTSLGFFPAVTVTGFTFLSLLIPIPGQLGAHEALQVAAFQSLGLAGHTGAAFAFLVRAAELLIALGGLVVFARLAASLLQRLVLGRVERAFQKLFLS